MGQETWVFEPTPEMGGATGEAYTNPLLGTGMDPEAVLAREAIQNSSDALEKGGKVKVVFRRVSLTGQQKREFVKSMQLSPAMTDRKELKLPKGACLGTLRDSNEPLELLYVEDFGTFGLHGDPFSSRSHFFRLLLSLGDGSKARDAKGSGGSYGFGKSVYSSNSRIHTIVAYSVFDPKLSGESKANHARLMGCAYFHAHEHRDQEFSGRGWFGIPKAKGVGAEPLVDTEAHSLAERLGFQRRDEGQRGTSLLIVDCGVQSDQLRESIEEWWWPRLIDSEHGLDVVMIEDGKLLAPPRPRKRADLRPFIECFDLAVGRTSPTGDHQKQGSLNRLHEKELGDYGFVVLPDNAAAEDERLPDRFGTIALIRAPRMVIEYMNVGGLLPLPCVGAFVANPEIDEYLKRSEPASHDKWDPKSARLHELPDEARDVVGAVLKRLRSNLRKFSTDAAPKAADQETRLRSLEKLLGDIFRPPTTTPDPPAPGGSDPISLHFTQQPFATPAKGGIETKGSFRISISDEADRDSVKVLVRVTCYVQEDDGVSREDPIPVHLETKDLGAAAKKPADGELIFQLDRAHQPSFTFRSEPYNRDWSVNVQVHVEEVV